MIAKLLWKLFQSLKKLDDKDDDKDEKEDRIGGMYPDEFMKKLVKGKLDDLRNNREGKGEDMDYENMEGFFDEMGKVFNRGQNNRTGKGRHNGVRQRNKRGDKLSTNELKQAAQLEGQERFDADNLFEAANRTRKWYKRVGIETAMGMDAAVRTILTTATGSPSAQAQTDFEIQGIRIQHNGDGASAAATIAIHDTLLAHLAFTQIKVGDDNMLTTSNMVGAYVFADRNTEGGDLAGYVATTTQQVSMSIVNNAGYSALIIVSVVGEVVAEWK